MATLIHNLAGGTLAFAPLRGAFDYIFIDEAGHAWEPETLSCVAALARAPPGTEAGAPAGGGPAPSSSSAYLAKAVVSLAKAFAGLACDETGEETQVVLLHKWDFDPSLPSY
jgi:hypothetical protein